MGEPGPRVAYWMEVFCDLASRPLTAVPERVVREHLDASFSITGVSYNWRERDGQWGLEISPEEWMVTQTELHQELVAGRLVDLHPLITWFAVTGDPAPWTSARVPSAMVPGRRRAAVHRLLSQLDGEQQLSIPYRLDGAVHRAFVLGRSRRDFDDDDLVVAGYVQRALVALDTQAELVGGLRRGGSIESGTSLGLTGRELAVLALLADGHATRVVGRRLGCSPRTVDKHLERIYRKLAVSDRLNAVRVARQAGILDPTGSDRVSYGPNGGVPA